MAYDRSTLDYDAAEAISNGFVSKSGTVLGGLVTLPESLALVVNAAQPWLVDELTKFGADPLKKGATAAARALKVANPEKVGDFAGKAATMALPYTLNIGDVITTSKMHVERRREILQEVAPLLSANKEASKSGGVVGSVKSIFDNGYSDNKMIASALNAVKQETYTKLTEDATKLIPSIANNYSAAMRDKVHEAELKHYEALQLDEGRQRELAIASTSAALGAIKEKANKASLAVNSSGIVTEGLKKYVARDDGDRVANTSFGKVLQLQQFIRANALDAEDRMVSSSAVEQVADRVADIFQTYQKEQRHKAIPSHRLKDVSLVLAEELVGGELHTLSLVNIIGKDKLLTEGKDGLVSAEKVKAVIKDEVSHFSKSSTITAQEFLDGAGYSLDDVKAHLASKDKDVRALVAVLHPDSVLLEAGAKKEDIKEMRSHVSKKMMEGVYSAVLNGLNQQSTEQLEALGLDRRDLKYLEEHEGQPIQAELRNKANEAHVKKIVAKALMGEEETAHGGHSTAWRDAIAAGKTHAAKGHGKKPAANDESSGHIARKGASANDGQYMLAANAGKGGPRGPMDHVDRDSGEIQR